MNHINITVLFCIISPTLFHFLSLFSALRTALRQEKKGEKKKGGGEGEKSG